MRSRQGARAAAARGALPWPLGVPALLGALFLLVPLAGLLVRTPWQGLPRVLADSQVLDALRLSLVCASTATALSLVFGVPLAWVLARWQVRGISVLRALVTLPLVLPPVVGGVALLLVFGRQGILGRLLDEWTGITLPFTTAGVIVAETFVAMPFLVITFAGNFPGRTQTMPLAVYLALESDPDAAVALSLILLVVSIAVLAGLRDRWLSAGTPA